MIKKIGHSTELGKYVVLQDTYGNRYTYAQLGRTSKAYPAPRESSRPATTTSSPKRREQATARAATAAAR